MTIGHVSTYKLPLILQTSALLMIATAPPKMMMTTSPQKGNLPALVTSRMPVNPDVTLLGNSATVDVMFAAKGDIPDKIKTGRVINEPPPAKEFCSPAQKPEER